LIFYDNSSYLDRISTYAPPLMAFGSGCVCAKSDWLVHWFIGSFVGSFGVWLIDSLFDAERRSRIIAIIMWVIKLVSHLHRVWKKTSRIKIAIPGSRIAGSCGDVLIPGFRDYKNSLKSHFFER